MSVSLEAGFERIEMSAPGRAFSDRTAHVAAIRARGTAEPFPLPHPLLEPN
jgi:hypothetical protein